MQGARTTRVHASFQRRFVLVFEEWARVPHRRVDGRKVDRVWVDDVVRNVDDVDEVRERHRFAVDARAAEKPHASFARGERGREIRKAFRAGDGCKQ